jgi:hypothetical protein
MKLPEAAAAAAPAAASASAAGAEAKTAASASGTAASSSASSDSKTASAADSKGDSKASAADVAASLSLSAANGAQAEEEKSKEQLDAEDAAVDCDPLVLPIDVSESKVKPQPPTRGDGGGKGDGQGDSKGDSKAGSGSETKDQPGALRVIPSRGYVGLSLLELAAERAARTGYSLRHYPDIRAIIRGTRVNSPVLCALSCALSRSRGPR